MREMPRMGRFLGLAVALVAVHAPPAAGQSREAVETVTAERAARMIRGEAGRVRLVLLYETTCPASRRMFPDFVALAERFRGQGGRVLAFAVDEIPEPVQFYLGDGPLPFRRYQVQPWQSGALHRAMQPANIDIGATWGTPLLAVIDENGELVGQWEGAQGTQYARRWLWELGFDF